MLIQKMNEMTSRGKPVVHVSLTTEEFAQVVGRLDVNNALRKVLLANPGAKVLFSAETGEKLFSEPREDKSWRGAIYR